MRDSYGRKIDYLRISVTDRCNFRCVYCMPEEGIEKLAQKDILSLEEIIEVVEIAAETGVRKIRFTGGEPLIRRNFIDLLERVGKIEGIEDLAITTNGYLFSPMAEDLKKVGLKRVNFSLDTLDNTKFKQITRGFDLDRVLEAIDLALELDFEVKVNTVLIDGFNDDEIEDLVHFTKDRDLELRFIELMPIGESANLGDNLVTKNQVLERVPGLKALGISGVAELFKMPSYQGRLGFISPMSHSFCSACNRLRLTADGKLKPCLHSRAELDLLGFSMDEKRQVFLQAIGAKPKEHNLKEGSETERTMNKIGG